MDPVYDIPCSDEEDGRVRSLPPALPPKLSSSSFKDVGDMMGKAQIGSRPVPKPRKRVSKRQSESPTPCGPRPVPRPRPRTQSKESDEMFKSDIDAFESKLPPDADEAAKMVEDEVNAEYAEVELPKKPIYEIEEFCGKRPENPVDERNILSPDRVPTLQVSKENKESTILWRSTNHVSNALSSGFESTNPTGDISFGSGSTNQNSGVPLFALGSTSQTSGLSSFGLGSANQRGGISSGPVESRIENLTDKSMPSSVLPVENIPFKFVSGVTTELSSSEPRHDDDDTYEPLWFTSGTSTQQKKTVMPDLMNFSPDPEPTKFQFLESTERRTPKVTLDFGTKELQTMAKLNTKDSPKPVLDSSNDFEGPAAKLNITDRWGEYATLDPRASIVYEQPPPLYPPPPLPNIGIKVVRLSAPPVPPRPQGGFEGAADDVGRQSESVPSSAVFKELETPKMDPFQDDPFKYSDFATECTKFNQSGFDGQASLQVVDVNNVYEEYHDDQEDFDPFGLRNDQSDSSSQKSALSVSSGGASASRISLSHVPPPPGEQVFHTPPPERQNFNAASVENLYSLAHDMETSVDSSDSSDDPFSTEMHERNSSASITGAVPIVAPVSSSKSEKYGYLYKQGGVKANKGWKRRWVIFNGQDLRYFVNNKSQISKRVIPMSCMKEVVNDVKENDTNRFKFKLITTLRDRVFIFAADSLEDCLKWSQTLMAAIHDYEKNYHDDIEDETETPDKQGYIKFENGGRKYYVTIKGSKLRYFHNIEDFKMSSPISEINMELASVKNMGKNKLQLSTHYAHFQLSFESTAEAQQWKMAMEDAIAEGLADDSVLEKVYENDSNRICADCEMPNPHWASINLGIVLCKKCAGIHRMFDFTISKIRSLRMDTRVWTPSLIQLMKAIGNANANNFWEYELLPEQKIDSDAPSQHRKQFIQNKYKSKLFYQHVQAYLDKRILNEELLRVAATDNLLQMMAIVFSGANILYHRLGEDDNTAYQIAKHAGHRLSMEFLYQNGGDNSAADMFQNDEGRLREDVRHQGYLYKTGPNHKGFDKRWCVLEHGALTYYLTEKSNTAKDSIDRKTIYCLQATSVERQSSAFEISTSKGSNRVYLFAADNDTERGMWLRAIAKLMCPIEVMEHVGMMDFSLAGNFFLKDTIAEDWKKTWIMLNWRILYYQGANKNLETVDLRKANSIKFQNTANSCRECVESGCHFIVNAPGRALYIQADLSKDTERLFHALVNAINQSGFVLQDQQLTAEDVPVIVDKCISFITVNGVMEKGIYRESATNSKVQCLLNELRKDARSVRMEEFTCNEVANALKRFFRELEDSLFTGDRYSEWIRTAVLNDHKNKIAWYKYLLEKLPLVNYNTLKRLIIHLHRIAEHTHTNMMSAVNLATCFAPTLMRSSSDKMDNNHIALNYEMVVLTDIMQNHEYLLPVEDDEKRKEEVIAEAARVIQLMSDNTRRSMVIDNLLLSIHMFDVKGQCESVRVQTNDTVAEVIAYLTGKRQKTGRYALHEILFRGELERPLHATTNVISTASAWSSWEDSVSKDAALCFKSAELFDKICNAYDPGHSLCGKLDFSEKKSFKKQTFQFQQSKLTCFKDSKGTHLLYSWNIEDLVIYKGVDPRRSSIPSKFGLTFLVKGEKPAKKDPGFFGRSICFSSEQELLRWLAGLLWAQHPEGLSS